MTDKEKLAKVRAEIERVKKNQEGVFTSYTDGKFDLCEHLLSFIDSMQEESVSEELNTVAKEYANNITDKIGYRLQLRRAVCFGAKWQKEQMERYRIEHCKSLTNEQAELEDNFVSSHVEKNNRIPTFIDAIEYGIEYGKQQMMAKAIRGHVGQTINGMLRALSDETFGDIGFTAGDKVRLIIIKED